MANDINNYITIEGNEAVQFEFARLINSINKHDKKSGVGVEEVLFGESEPTRDWSIKNMGAKWVRVDDALDEDYLVLTSAWSACEGVQDKIHEMLKKFDEDVEVHMIYEDEMPLFTGYRVLWRDEDIDHVEDDGLDEELYNIAEKAGEGPWDDTWMEKLEEIRDVVMEKAQEELNEHKREEHKNEQTI